MTRLVIGHGLFLPWVHDTAFFLQACNYPLDRLIKVRRLHGILSLPRGKKSRLVYNVGEIRAHATEHLDETRSGDADRRQSSLARERAGHPRLPCAGGTVEENAPGEA